MARKLVFEIEPTPDGWITTFRHLKDGVELNTYIVDADTLNLVMRQIKSVLDAIPLNEANRPVTGPTEQHTAQRAARRLGEARREDVEAGIVDRERQRELAKRAFRRHQKVYNAAYYAANRDRILASRSEKRKAGKAGETRVEDDATDGTP